MNLYLWTRINSVSYNHHSEGGLVVIAKNIENAAELIAQYNEKARKEKGYDRDAIAFAPLDERDKQEKMFGEYIPYQLDGFIAPDIFVFPDAGCC